MLKSKALVGSSGCATLTRRGVPSIPLASVMEPAGGGT
jgi:hypothetical protein